MPTIQIRCRSPRRDAGSPNRQSGWPCEFTPLHHGRRSCYGRTSRAPRGRATVILMGAASDGANLYAGTEAFFRHYQTIVEVDAIGGEL
jgi:hypothetical protein